MTKLSFTLAEKIIEYLKKFPELRDDYQYILALLWREQIGSNNLDLGKLARGEIHSPESVRREWQKILEKIPELRGPGYNRRHGIAEPEFKKELKKLEKKIKPQQDMDL